jgi:hypothetical protein
LIFHTLAQSRVIPIETVGKGLVRSVPSAITCSRNKATCVAISLDVERSSSLPAKKSSFLVEYFDASAPRAFANATLPRSATTVAIGTQVSFTDAYGYEIVVGTGELIDRSTALFAIATQWFTLRTPTTPGSTIEMKQKRAVTLQWRMRASPASAHIYRFLLPTPFYVEPLNALCRALTNQTTGNSTLYCDVMQCVVCVCV